MLFFLQWPWARAGRVVNAWQSWAPHGPHELWSNLHLSAPFGGPPQVTVGGTWLGHVSGATSVIRSLINRVGFTPSVNFVREESFLTAMLVEAAAPT